MEIEITIFVLEIIGTVAFAFSGAMTAIKKELDILGVIILGIVTAVGGGIIRDTIIGIVPPKAFIHPIYALTALIIAIGVFIMTYIKRNLIDDEKSAFHHLMMAADTIGLGIFTVVGVKAGFDMGYTNHFLNVFLGVITGVGGGLLRDIMSGSKPYIFVKHVYACSSIAGALVSTFMWKYTGANMSMLTGTAVVCVLRFLAIKYRWNLPKIKLS